MRNDINVDRALRNFRRIYPEINHISIIGETKNKTVIVIFVGDGYHAISENFVSHFYSDKEDALNFDA